MYTDYGRDKLISDKISDALNTQINKEFYSAYLYLSMGSYFHSIGLYGFMHWMQIQAKEEVDHGMIIFNYLLRQNSKIDFHQINSPEVSFKNHIEAFNFVAGHEKKVTESIKDIIKLAKEEDDQLTKLFLNFYVKEQFEEEVSVGEIVSKLKLFGDSKCSLFALDEQLSRREQKNIEYDFLN